jgi:hypothetical protein
MSRWPMRKERELIHLARASLSVEQIATRMKLAHAESQGKMKGWKWVGDVKVLICIIAALIFVIWMVLQQQYY